MEKRLHYINLLLHNTYLYKMILGFYRKYTLFNERRQMLFCISGDTTLSVKLLAVVIGQAGEHSSEGEVPEFATWHVGQML